MIDRTRWGLAPYREKPKKWAVETLSSNDFFETPTVCRICDHPLQVKIHKSFRESFVTGFWGPSDKGIAESGEDVLNRILKALRGMATCDRCFKAREDYVAARENIIKVANWVSRLFDPVSGMSRAEPEDQKKKQDILISWTKKWSEALRRMNKQLTLVYCDEMAGIIWKRPNAADYYLDAIEQRIYNGTKPYEQERSVKNLWNSVQ